MHAPIPEDEAQRLVEVRELLSFKETREERFARIARIACKMYQVPVAMVAWMGEETQLIKGVCGFDVSRAPRDISFCSHTIYQHAPLIINDTQKDERFKSSPWVTEPPHVRFYAGYPIQGPQKGQPVGTVCLYAFEPREFSDAELALLKDLALQVEESLVVDWSLEVGDRLRAQAKELTQHFDETTDLVTWSRDDGDLAYVNGALLRSLGYRGGVRPQNLKEILPKAEPSQSRHLLSHRSGEKVAVKGGGTVGSLNSQSVIRWTFRDLSMEVSREKRLKELAETDELTGVLNRRGLLSRLEPMLEQNPFVCVAMVDLDHLKSVNDELGHDAGDEAIRRVARCLSHSVRSTDLVGRIGGDEFCVALPNISVTTAWRIFDRFHQMYGDGAPRTSKVVTTASVGVARVEGGHVTDALALADKQLYKAKTSGRDQTC